MESEIMPEEDIKSFSAPVVVEGNNMLSESFIETAAKQVELRSKLIMTALKALKPHDIQDFDGKPYIEGEGAARIMSVIRGFKVSESKFVVEIIHPHYFIECNTPMEFMGATTVAIGDCSTADPFFCGKDGQGGQYKRHLERTGSDTMAARMIVGDAKKKARENSISRGVTELLGLKGLSWDDLEKWGFERSGAGSTVAFKGGSQGGEIKTLIVKEALDSPVGSLINVRGRFVSSEERTAKEKKISGYTLEGGIIIQKWGPIETGFMVGQELFCSKVKVTTYNDKKQFTADSIEIVEP